MDILRVKPLASIILILASSFGACRGGLSGENLLEANMLVAVGRALRDGRETVALSGRLREQSGSPLENARVSFAPSGGGGTWVCTTDQEGFWNIDMTIPGGSVSFTATVQKNAQTIAVFVVTIGIGGGRSGSLLTVSTSVISGAIEAEAAGYVRSSLLVTRYPPLLLEGKTSPLRLKFNQAQNETRTVTARSDLPSLTVSGLEASTLTFEPSNSTVDQTLSLAALADPNITSESATVTIHSEGIPDIQLRIVLQDADVPSMQVTGSTTLSENSGSTVLWVRPDFALEEATTFALSTTDAGRLAVTPASITFTPENQTSYQAITVTAASDPDFTTESVSVRFEAPDLPSILLPISLSDETALFEAPVNATAGAGSSALSCDLNQDGPAEAIVALASTAELRVLPNESSGAPVVLGAAGSVPLAHAGARALGCADLDGDGRVDLALVHPLAGQLELLRNTTAGSITFAAGTTLAVGAGPTDVLLADFDGDGLADVITADRSAGSLSVWRNTSTPGSLSFVGSTVPAAVRPAFLAAGDFNGDGKPDLVVAHDFLSANSISVYENTSTISAISFAAPRVVSGLSGFGLVVADLDGNGRPEIVTITESGTHLRILTSSVATPFVFDVHQLDSGMDGIPSDVFARHLAAADLDGDGLAELVLANRVDGRGVVFRNLGGLLFSGAHVVATGDFVAALLSDLNGTGRIDASFLKADGSWLALGNALP